MLFIKILLFPLTALLIFCFSVFLCKCHSSGAYKYFQAKLKRQSDESDGLLGDQWRTLTMGKIVLI